MKPNSALICVVLSIFILLIPVSARDAQESTTLVAGGGATANGAPLLWKNRDTDTLSNKVVFVQEQPYSYLALVNAEDTSGRIAWAGLNAVGFAIANSVAYNLPQVSGEEADLEGHIMADALRTCRTIAEFERFLDRNKAASLGARANFLVIDAGGGASIFETHNHGVKRLDASAFPGERLPNTNFSRSGGADDGAGYLRFDRESSVLEGIPAGGIDVPTALQVLARDLGHALLRHPARADWKNLPADSPYWIHTNHTINRASTASAVVVQGVRKDENPLYATMWVILGEPVTGIAVPLWVDAGVPPEALWKGKDAPIAAESFRLKALLRPLKARERGEYADLARLDNAAGTGWLPSILAAEREIINETDRFLAGQPTVAQLAEFQKTAAAKGLAALANAGRERPAS
jgi:hypothetical protein